MMITLRAARINAGYTQDRAARAVGITRQTLCNYESGRSPITARHYYQLCELYGVPTESPIIIPNTSGSAQDRRGGDGTPQA